MKYKGERIKQLQARLNKISRNIANTTKQPKDDNTIINSHPHDKKTSKTIQYLHKG